MEVRHFLLVPFSTLRLSSPCSPQRPVLIGFSVLVSRCRYMTPHL